MKEDIVIQKLSALAQESRLIVFRLLMSCGAEGLCAGDISKQTGISPNTLSFHLKELASAKLITSQKQGRSIFYSLDTEAYKELLQFLTKDCCAGNPELCQPTSPCC